MSIVKEQKNTVATKKPVNNNFTNKGGFKARPAFKPRPTDDLISSVLSIRTVSKTRAGGRRRGFAVLVAVGDRKGKLGIGSARSVYCNEAIQKAERRAKKKLMTIPMISNRTITHNVEAKVCSTKVLIQQAKPGKGIIAGGKAWDIFDLIGLKDVVCKFIGATTSTHNMVYAVVDALNSLESLSDIAERRNKTIEYLIQKKHAFKIAKTETN